MKPFDDWFEDLISNEIWAGPARMLHRPETFRKIANKVYMEYVAKEHFPPIQEARTYVYRLVFKTPGDIPKGKPWHQKELEKIEEKKQEEWTPVTGEERQRRLAEYKALIDSMPLVNNFPRVTEQEKAENCDWIPKKQAPYPVTSPMEAYVKDRHIAYIQQNYDARTAEKLPGWVSEEEFNVRYDEKNL